MPNVFYRNLYILYVLYVLYILYIYFCLWSVFFLLKSRILVLLLYFVFFRRLGGNMRSLLCLIEINGQRFYYIAVAVVVSLFVVVARGCCSSCYCFQLISAASTWRRYRCGLFS